MYSPTGGFVTANTRNRLALSSATSSVAAKTRVAALKTPTSDPPTAPRAPPNSKPVRGPSMTSKTARAMVSNVLATNPMDSRRACSLTSPKRLARSANRRRALVSSNASSQPSTTSLACERAVSPDRAKACVSAAMTRGSAVTMDPRCNSSMASRMSFHRRRGSPRSELCAQRELATTTASLPKCLAAIIPTSVAVREG